jgi:hypothetical protein
VKDLAARIRAARLEVTRDGLEAMYRDPYWLDRFGERGRAFALEDGLHHVNYLCNALWIGNPETLENYARWLQNVLTTRGMCTLHAEENFARLADALRARDLDEGEAASRFLAAAREALRYRAAGAGLQEAGSRLAAKAAEGMGTARLREAAALASFLADAAALSTTTSLLLHVAWLRAYHARIGVFDEVLPRMLDRLAAGVRELAGLSGEERAFALAAIASAAKAGP